MSFDELRFNASSLAARAEAHGAASPYAALDRIIRARRTKQYPQQLWWLIASFIGLIAIVQFLSWTISKFSSRTPLQKKPGDAEVGESTPAPARHSSWRRLPTALINLYRVVAFRWSLNIGSSYTLTFAELFVTAAYIVALLTWEFVNSQFVPPVHPSTRALTVPQRLTWRGRSLMNTTSRTGLASWQSASSLLSPPLAPRTMSSPVRLRLFSRVNFADRRRHRQTSRGSAMIRYAVDAIAVT